MLSNTAVTVTIKTYGKLINKCSLPNIWKDSPVNAVPAVATTAKQMGPLMLCPTRGALIQAEEKQKYPSL
jgi:hypothetical protein